MPLTAPSSRLLLAARRSKVPVRLSRDAGRYLCNYLCWRAAEAAARPGGPRLVSFVHVPLVRPSVTARSRRLALDDLARAGTAILTAFVAAARRSLPNVNLAQT
jgi:pyroglutamyl-peptidase